MQYTGSPKILTKASITKDLNFAIIIIINSLLTTTTIESVGHNFNLAVLS